MRSLQLEVDDAKVQAWDLEQRPEKLWRWTEQIEGRLIATVFSHCFTSELSETLTRMQACTTTTKKSTQYYGFFFPDV